MVGSTSCQVRYKAALLQYCALFVYDAEIDTHIALVPDAG